MPPLKLYNRTWYTTSDMLPLPAFIFIVINVVWLAIFLPLIVRLDVWKPCNGQGLHYVVTTSALFAIFATTLLLMLGIFVCGSRGAVFELSKRRGAILLLYIQSFVWGAQAVFMVYGTVIMYTVEPTCWNQPGKHRSLRNLTHAMVYSIWGLVLFTLLLVWIVYDSYQDQDSLKAWEQRLLRISRWLQCKDNLVASMEGQKGDPLPSIAQWISALFAHVDLSPSDLSEAIVLTAAMQGVRREVQIKQALTPIIEKAGSDLDLQGLEGSETNMGPLKALKHDIEAGPDAPLGDNVLPNARNATTLAEGPSSSDHSNESAKSGGEAEASGSDFQPPELDPSVNPPPLITPSGKVSEAVGSAVPVEQAVQEAIGKMQMVGFEELEQAGHWVCFAAAAYAILPFSEPTRTGGCCGMRTRVTEGSVRDSILDLAGIRAPDLLYFSHSNTALAHLPYLLALDRQRKAVVMAVRGTMSLADLVTDAVVFPQPLSDWLDPPPPGASEKDGEGHKSADKVAHAGITSAAQALLADLEVHGILGEMLQPQGTPTNSFHRRSPANGESTDHGDMLVNTNGVQSGGVFPQDKAADAGEDQEAQAESSAESSTKRRGKAVGEAIREKLDNQGWKFLITGHSLGAGAAALVGLKLRSRYPGLRVWAYSPPGGLVSNPVVQSSQAWCTSVVVGKDMVPRMTIDTLGRLMDDMVVSLAFCRHHKLSVLLGRWWYEESRPPPQRLFHTEASLPEEARETLEQYRRSNAAKDQGVKMFPPGRLMFVRPVKKLTGKANRRESKVLWDAVWITPQELVAEGILVSRKMLVHHSIEATVMGALGYAARHHPDNPEPPREKAKQAKRQRERQSELREVRTETEDSGPLAGDGRLSTRGSI